MQALARDEAAEVSKVIFIVCLNILSLGCLSQLLNNDLLDNVNYSALKQKLILFLITWIRLMDEYLEIARQAVKKKTTIISCHYLSLQIRIITTLCHQINRCGC